MAVKWLREKCLFLLDYRPFSRRGVRRDSHAPGNIWVRVRVSFTTGAVRSAILASCYYKFFLRNSTLSLLFIYTVNIHGVLCDAIMMS